MPMAHARMASTAPWISPSQKSAQGAYCRIALVRPIMWYYDPFERAGNIQVERRTLSTKEEGDMAETGRLRQRRILITGAASGIGRRTAQRFVAARGAVS